MKNLAVAESTRQLLADPRVQELLQASRDRENARVRLDHYEGLAREARALHVRDEPAWPRDIGR